MLAAHPADPVVDAELDRLTNPLNTALVDWRREHVTNLGLIHPRFLSFSWCNQAGLPGSRRSATNATRRELSAGSRRFARRPPEGGSCLRQARLRPCARASHAFAGIRRLRRREARSVPPRSGRLRPVRMRGYRDPPLWLKPAQVSSNVTPEREHQ